MKLSQAIILALVFSLLSFSSFAQSSAQPIKTAKEEFNSWKRATRENAVNMGKGNWWALSAIVEKVKEGAKLGFYITAANEIGAFPDTDIIVQPTIEYYDSEGVPRTTDVGNGARIRIPAVVINKGQADE